MIAMFVLVFLQPNKINRGCVTSRLATANGELLISMCDDHRSQSGNLSQWRNKNSMVNSKLPEDLESLGGSSHAGIGVEDARIPRIGENENMLVEAATRMVTRMEDGSGTVILQHSLLIARATTLLNASRPKNKRKPNQVQQGGRGCFKLHLWLVENQFHSRSTN